MSQSGFLGSGGVNKGKETLKPRLQIMVPHFDNSELIKGYSQTLIGRCMNPQKQDVKFLITTFPRIWKMENRVTGADLGRGRFQFDFDEEEDIKTVLRMGPYHFDHWMVSLVRWQPVLDPFYPSAITFWVRLVELPLQFWAEPTFREIGKALGTVEDVDIDGGRVQVCLNGFKPLAFEGSINFGGHEVPVFLTYERLVGFCNECYSLCHDKDRCPTLLSKREERAYAPTQRRDEIPDTRFLSYKGAVQASSGEGVLRRSQPDERKVDYKGKGKMYDNREGRGLRQNDLRGKQRNDGEGGSNQHIQGYAPPKELRKRLNESMRGDLKIVETKVQGPMVFTKDPTGGIIIEAGASSLPTSPYHSANKVRSNEAVRCSRIEQNVE